MQDVSERLLECKLLNDEQEKEKKIPSEYPVVKPGGVVAKHSGLWSH